MTEAIGALLLSSLLGQGAASAGRSSTPPGSLVERVACAPFDPSNLRPVESRLPAFGVGLVGTPAVDRQAPGATPPARGRSASSTCSVTRISVREGNHRYVMERWNGARR